MKVVTMAPRLHIEGTLRNNEGRRNGLKL